MKSLLTTLLLITGISIAQPPPGTFLPPSYPQTISFQAMMTDTLGNPVADGTHNFTFRISSPAQGGAEYMAICLPAFSPATVHRDQ